MQCHAGSEADAANRFRRTDVQLAQTAESRTETETGIRQSRVKFMRVDCVSAARARVGKRGTDGLQTTGPRSNAHHRVLTPFCLFHTLSRYGRDAYGPRAVLRTLDEYVHLHRRRQRERRFQFEAVEREWHRQPNGIRRRKTDFHERRTRQQRRTKDNVIRNE